MLYDMFTVDTKRR